MLKNVFFWEEMFKLQILFYRFFRKKYSIHKTIGRDFQLGKYVGEGYIECILFLQELLFFSNKFHNIIIDQFKI